MSKRLYYLTIFLLFLFLNIQAQEQKLSFEPLTTLNGLPTNEVRRLYQDREGYLWIATTDGLCSYDGYQIKTYKSNMYSPELLSSNNIRCVAEDTNHHLFIGTNSGLNILDKLTGKIKKTQHKEFYNNVITTMLVTSGGLVLIGSDTDLYLYDVVHDTCKPCRMDGQSIKAQHIYEDSHGQIWIGSFYGLFLFDPHTQHMIAYPRINNNNSAHIICEDSFHRLWIGSFGQGLFVIENPYDINHLRIHSFIAEKGNSKSLCDNTVYALIEDKTTHTLWVGTRSGVSLLPIHKDKIDRNFINYLPGQNNPAPFDEVNALLQDRQGTVWLGTLGGGVYSVKTQKPMFGLNSLTEVRKELTSNSVRSMMQNRDGKIWLGIGSYGLVVQDKKSNTYTHFSKLPGFEKFPSMPTLNTIVQLRDGRVLMGGFADGYYEYDEKKPIQDRACLHSIDNTPWMMNNRVLAILEDKKGNCWFGTKTGLCVLSGKSGIALRSFMVEGKDLSNNSFQCLSQDTQGNLWIGTNDAGLIKASYKDKNNPHKLQSRQYTLNNGKLNNNDIQCVFVDHQGRVWVGTDGGGVCLYNEKKDKFTPINILLDLPCDGVYSILEDEDGHLWMGTNSGLLCLNTSTPIEKSTFKLYTLSAGLQDNIFLRGCAFRASDGEMFFGGHKGYNFFYPSQLKNNSQPSQICITDIKIFNVSWDALPIDKREKVSKLAPNFTHKIVLNYQQNNFNIEFSAMNFVNPMQNKYSYKLAGYDKEWQITDATHRFAYYNNLKPGTYTFCLKVMDENGTWSKSTRTIKVVILPPFWLTWWAFVLYVVVAMTVVYLIWRQARNRLKEQNQLHMLKVEKSKIEELNHAKLQFFTNITHELLTPLTIILATMDELKIEDPNHPDLYGIMNTHAIRLKRLIQQILEFRKSESGNLKLKVSPGNIATFVKNEAESFIPLIQKKKLHFSVLCVPDEIFGYYDSDKLDKIIYNLLSNAAKYNKPGGFVQLNLNYGKDKSCIELAVKDNGSGISPERQKSLFKRFYEGDYRRYNTIGTGIGLSLTKDLVELHGGSIRVDSEEGKGTTFFVTLPIDKVYYKPEEIDEQIIPVQNTLSDIVEADSTITADDTKKEHAVLVVEDNEDLLQVMVKLLGRDYKVFQATNGKEGIDVIENEDVDIVVSDVMMPEMDGIELTKYLKENMDYSHIPVILLTAKTKEEDRAEAYECGADAFITKPFNLSVLLARIKNLLKKQERTARDFKSQLVFEMKELDYTSLDEQFMQKAVDCVNKHLDDSNFDVPQFIEEMGTSKTTLYKKLKSLTGLSTSSFIRNIRLKVACRIMEENPTIRISDLAYEVGFNDPKYFSLCFKKEFGMLPNDYCERFIGGK